jgi:diguanylate cyclase (GGDEF)-like protein
MSHPESMIESKRQWERALDVPGSAGTMTIRRSIAFSVAIVAMAVVVAAVGDAELQRYPQFATFHAGFVFLVDLITSFLLFGQFIFRRQPAYLALAGAFLFSSLVMVPFLLAFPGALAEGSVIGGPQSAIWLWHVWHALFPAFVAVSLWLHARGPHPVPRPRVMQAVASVVGLVVVLLGLAILAVTLYHDRLPVLIIGARHPYGPNFFLVGGIVIAITLWAFFQALNAARQRSILHIWLAVMLLAFLADESASIGAFPRFSLGWYLGRIDSMFAASALLVVFLGDINRLYRRLAEAVSDAFEANRRLSAMVEEKDALLLELQHREEQIRRMAYHDAITNLPNRRLLMETLVHVLAQAERHGRCTALLFIDLDSFKQVNDTFGHEVGDALLKEVALILERCVRAGDMVARLGGDEFVILLPDIAYARDAETVAEKALRMIGDERVLLGHRIPITVSIGIVISSAGERISAGELIRRADQEMYAAKKAGKNRYSMRATTGVDGGV